MLVILHGEEQMGKLTNFEPAASTLAALGRLHAMASTDGARNNRRVVTKGAPGLLEADRGRRARRVELQMQQQNFTPLYPPLQVRAGVLVVDGFGIALRVLYPGKLHVNDGLGRQRRELVLDRAGSGLERLVLIGKAGSVTLEALAWLRAIGAALVQIGRDGEVLAHSVPYGYDGHPIRRAQALAVTNGLGPGDRARPDRE